MWYEWYEWYCTNVVIGLVEVLPVPMMGNAENVKRRKLEERKPVMVLKMSKKMLNNGNLSAGRTHKLTKMIRNLKTFDKEDDGTQWQARSVTV